MSTARRESASRPTIALELLPKIVEALNTLDPWTIYKPDALIDAGIPPELVEHCTMEFKSDLRDPKATITASDGHTLAIVWGVYSLHLAREVCRAFQVEYEGSLGRGSEYRNIMYALNARVKIIQQLEVDAAARRLTP